LAKNVIKKGNFSELSFWFYIFLLIKNIKKIKFGIDNQNKLWHNYFGEQKDE